MITPEMLARSGTEHGEQAALFCWAGLPNVRGLYPALEWMYAIPNGGQRDKVTAAKLKAEGVKAGIADVHLPVRTDSGFSGLYIELKRANGVPSDFNENQIDFAKFVNREGYAWYPAFGWREAVHIIECYFKGIKPSLTPNQQKVFNRFYE